MKQYEPGDQVRIIGGDWRENYLKTATVSSVLHGGDVAVYFGDQNRDEWVYSPPRSNG